MTFAPTMSPTWSDLKAIECSMTFDGLDPTSITGPEIVALKASIASQVNVGYNLTYTDIKNLEITDARRLDSLRGSEGSGLLEMAGTRKCALRKWPVYPGDRTGAVIEAGEKFAFRHWKMITHTHSDKQLYPITYYELSDGRGWVHDFNPKYPTVSGLQISWSDSLSRRHLSSDVSFDVTVSTSNSNINTSSSSVYAAVLSSLTNTTSIGNYSVSGVSVVEPDPSQALTQAQAKGS